MMMRSSLVFHRKTSTVHEIQQGQAAQSNMSPKEISTFNELNNSARTADIFVNNLKQNATTINSAYEGLWRAS